jgi:hypothetical protein
MTEPLPHITMSYTIVKPKMFAAVLVPQFPVGVCRSIPAQVGMPISVPSVAPSIGKEHPKEGSIATDEGKPSRTVENDPTLEK